MHSFSLFDPLLSFIINSLNLHHLVSKVCVLCLFLQYPWDIIKEAFKLGLMNGGVPAKYGGLGLGVLDECLMAEELSFGCTGIYTALTANGLAVGKL